MRMLVRIAFATGVARRRRRRCHREMCCFRLVVVVVLRFRRRLRMCVGRRWVFAFLQERDVTLDIVSDGPGFAGYSALRSQWSAAGGMPFVRSGWNSQSQIRIVDSVYRWVTRPRTQTVCPTRCPLQTTLNPTLSHSTQIQSLSHDPTYHNSTPSTSNFFPSSLNGSFPNVGHVSLTPLYRFASSHSP